MVLGTGIVICLDGNMVVAVVEDRWNEWAQDEQVGMGLGGF